MVAKALDQPINILYTRKMLHHCGASLAELAGFVIVKQGNEINISIQDF